ncbi:NTP transferase domain-containing protein [bacterium]|nr:NTP transferase domain-containing protein [bacterium]
MRAMILAAGFGSRLHELTRDYPKPLIQVQRHYLIEYALFLIKKAGIIDVMINTHYHADKIRDALQDGRKYGLHISYSHEEMILGTGGGVKRAETFFGHEPFVLINSDIICDIELTKVIDYHFKQNAAATMVVRDDTAMPNFDEIKLTQDYRIRAVGSQIRTAKSATFLNRMFTGIHVLDPIVFSYLKPEFSSIISDFYRIAIGDDLNIMGYDFSGFWMDAGSKESLDLARNHPLLPKMEF